jgi:hypothetical protein
MKAHPSIDRLRMVLRYEPLTGRFVWLARTPDPKNWNKLHAGKDAFTTNVRGYACGAVDRILLRGHRVAWAMHYGKWPIGEIDHINGDKSDNRIENLRDATPAENRRNQKLHVKNKSGKTGVFYDASRGRWIASISHNGKRLILGRFGDRERAVSVRNVAEHEYGYHPNHGRIRS